MNKLFKSMRITAIDLLSIVLFLITIILIIVGLSMNSILVLFGGVVFLFISITVDIYYNQQDK